MKNKIIIAGLFTMMFPLLAFSAEVTPCDAKIKKLAMDKVKEVQKHQVDQVCGSPTLVRNVEASNMMIGTGSAEVTCLTGKFTFVYSFRAAGADAADAVKICEESASVN